MAFVSGIGQYEIKGNKITIMQAVSTKGLAIVKTLMLGRTFYYQGRSIIERIKKAN